MKRYPPIFRIRQHFDRPRVEDVVAEVERQLGRLAVDARIRPGQSVAVTAGSRGIRDIIAITRAIVDHLRRRGAEPFLVPAMGSHGGGTAEGQRRLLASYGITSASIGCPVRSSMETVVLGQTAQGEAIHFDRLAAEADHVFVCNRVKSHTRFAAAVESGLLKMLLVGLGKARGAEVYHKAFERSGFGQVVADAIPKILTGVRLLGGLAILENAYDETARLEALRPEEFLTREPELLAQAKRWMPRLPFDAVDLLLIDEIGKDISGTGLDSNVVGRKFDDHKAVKCERPKVRLIALRDLTAATAGNANGIGMAEFCKTSLLQKVDSEATRFNAITAHHATAAMSPLDYPTDRAMLDATLLALGRPGPDAVKLLWIPNTLRLEEVECSIAFWDEASARDDLEIRTEPRPMPFDEQGNLPQRMVGS